MNRRPCRGTRSRLRLVKLLTPSGLCFPETRGVGVPCLMREKLPNTNVWLAAARPRLARIPSTPSQLGVLCANPEVDGLTRSRNAGSVNTFPRTRQLTRFSESESSSGGSTLAASGAPVSWEIGPREHVEVSCNVFLPCTFSSLGSGHRAKSVGPVAHFAWLEFVSSTLPQ